MCGKIKSTDVSHGALQQTHLYARKSISMHPHVGFFSSQETSHAVDLIVASAGNKSEDPSRPS